MTPEPEPVMPFARWEGAAFMATGAALVAHILIDVPLWLSALLAMGAAAGVIAVGARRHPHVAGRELALAPSAIIRVGVLSAVAALIAYDGTRLVVSEALAYEVGPFEALPHFGAGLVGDSASSSAQWVAGSLFHVANAITFAVAYTIWAGRRGVVAGVVFGLGLEAAMLGFYPAWLQIPNMREFASMSIVGHIAYGATLGVLAKRGLTALAPRSGSVVVPVADARDRPDESPSQAGAETKGG